MSDRAAHVADCDQKYADYCLIDSLAKHQTVPMFDLSGLAYAAWKAAEDRLRAHDDEVDHD